MSLGRRFVSPFKRRILVNRFQYRLILGNLLYLVTVVTAFVVVLFGPAMDLLESGADASSRQAVRDMFQRLWFAIPLLVALCVLHSTLISHRIAGPLIRFRQVFADVCRGKLTTFVRIREHDYLQTEAQLMALMIDSLRDRVRTIHEGYTRAGTTLPVLMQAVEHGSRTEAAVLAGKLGTELDMLALEIRQFQYFDTRASAEVDLPSIEPTREPTTTLAETGQRKEID